MVQKFESLWTDYIASLKGSLIAQNQIQPLTYEWAKLLLTDSMLTWQTEHTRWGQWLYKLQADEPAKGKLVKEILTQDMKFDPVDSSVNEQSLLSIGIPAGAAALGFGLAKLCKFGILGTCVSTLLPALVAVPLAHSYLSQKRSECSEQTINAYINQLNKYKESVISALMAE